MVIAAPEPKAEWQPVGEQRVVLRGLSWEAYLAFLEQAKEDEIEAMQSLRAWWQGQSQEN